MFPYLHRREVEDEFAQDNFKRIADYFNASPLERLGFKFFQIEAAGTFSYPHNLNFVPQDILVLYNSANATITYNYTDFTTTDINLTVSAPTTLRLLIGRYADG